MKRYYILHVTVLILGILSRNVYSLNPNGTNVKTTQQRYYVKQGVSVRVQKSRRTCSKKCTGRFLGWCYRYGTRCRTVYFHSFITQYKMVARYKPVYSCYDGWKAINNECTIPICAGECQNGGVCVSPNNCQCSCGWRGTRCRTDVDECKTNKHGCRYKPGCRNTQGSYRCTCAVGYYLSTDQRTCKDVDECKTGRYTCGENTVCNNTCGSYECHCNDGFKYFNESRKACTDLNECDPSSGILHGCQGTCVNVIGGYNCSCPAGHFLASDGKNCTDHNECESKNHGCGQICVNYPGGFSCSCNLGYRLNKINLKTCHDIDECSEGTSACSQICKNSLGSFSCSCKPGYFLGSDLKTCLDVDECKSGPCQRKCLNIPGGYKCECKSGYDWSPNKKNCIGRRCFPISTPANGGKNCSGYTTDHTCYFYCKSGYKLVGTQKRKCTPLRRWSGIKARCERIPLI